MNKKNFIVFLICIAILVLTCGCIEEDEQESLIMTFGDLLEDYNQNVDNETKTVTEWFISLEDGDTFLIRDAINSISYDEGNDITGIEFMSLVGERLSVAGDITGELKIRDNVELELHIKNVSFTEKDPYTGETWTFERETIQEGWDSLNNTYTPFPPQVIRKIDGADIPIIMNFLQFTQDYTQQMDNSTRTITYGFKSLISGDTLIIRDVINNTVYESENDYTNLEFSSALGISFPVEGDITGEFRKGDIIEIELHIISVNFTDQHPYTGEVWFIEMETYEEGWDDDKNMPILVPKSHLRHG
jgi:hypothetical protein